MKNFTKLMLLLMIFSLSAAVGFAQVSPNSMTAKQKEAYALSMQSKVPATIPGSIDVKNIDRSSRAVLLTEDFLSGIPGTWSQTQYAGLGVYENWTPSGYYYPGPPPNSDGYYAMANSDAHSAWTYDVGLFTPSMDMTGYSNVQIDLDANYYGFGSIAYGWCEVNVYSGGTAVANLEEQLLYSVANLNSHLQYTIDPSAYASPSNVYIEFYYTTNGMTWVYGFGIDNVVVDAITLGDVEGYVFNGGGLSINGATVECAGITTTSQPNGYYLLTGVPGGMNQDVMASKDGYNDVTENVFVPAAGVAYQDIILTAPNMTISPTAQDRTMNPNEYTSLPSTGILNTGDGPLDWNASVVYPLTDQVTGHAPVGQIVNTPPDPSTILTGAPFDDGTDATFDCAPADIFTNPNTPTTGAWSYTVSDPGFPNLVYSSFSGLTDPIGSVAFWGIQLTSTQGSCSDDPKDFLIEFYEAGATPGALVASYNVSSFLDPTGQNVVGFPVSQWYAEFPSVDLTDGWISIQSNSSCMLWWGNSEAGTGSCLDWNGSAYATNTGGARSFCLGASSGGSGSWLTLDYYSGTVAPGGGLDNVPTNFDAAGTSAGEVYTADIVFTSDPDVGTITIPCTMTIMGDPLVAPTDLAVSITDAVNGAVLVEWQWATDVTFQYFVVKRNGVTVGTTTNTTFPDFLPDYGTYCYTVQSVYDEGSASPAGPECVEWYIPDICWDPNNPENTQWIDVEAAVDLTVENCGEGTLEFTFPEYAVTDLLNDPNFVHNKVGDPWAGQEFSIAKGEDDPRDGLGYPVNRGAGGPDAFGYTWIDSDEAGGPMYDWTEISAIGTDQNLLGDDNSVSITLPFPFSFYDVDQTSMLASTNGYLTFGSDGTDFSNDPIPNTTDPNDLIAPFWDDFNMTAANGSKLYTYYDAGNARFIVQWSNVPKLGATALNTFQVILYANGKIGIAYESTNGLLNSATVGVENADGTVGLQVAYNATYIKNDLFVMIMPPQDNFVIDVEPAYGILTEGQSQDLTLTYSSFDFEAGTYVQDIECVTNAPVPHDMVLIPNTMNVYNPGELVGTVTDCNTGLPITGVTVSAGIWQDVTATDGTYAFYLDAGTYDVDFDKLGYQSYTALAEVVLESVQTTVDASLCEMPYAPAWVTAVPNDLDTECEVEWALPLGPYEILYDDGTSEDLVLWGFAGGENAVKFTPLGYPAEIIGGRVYVGDGNFPAGGFLGSSFSMVIYDDDGDAGMPGTVLDSIAVTVDNYGWITFGGGTATITDGDFYISMLQTQPSPTAPVGVDYSLPTVYRSYQRYAALGWQLSVYQDFMIRAFVEGPTTVTDGVADGAEIVKPNYYLKKGTLGTVILSQTETYPIVTSGLVGGGEISIIKDVAKLTTNRDLTFYEIARLSDFDPNVGPATGTLTILATNIIGQEYLDSDWAALLPGWYAYGVRAYYTNGDISPWAYSNTVQHQLDWEVTFEVAICDGSDPDGVLITMQGEDYPYNFYSSVTDVTGIIVFDSIIEGQYEITASKLGHEEIIFADNIFADVTYPILMCDNRFPPTGMWVDPLTSVAHWNYPVAPTVTEENFDGAFPPEGWTTSSNGQGWFPTTDGSSSAWAIPTWTSQYACANDDGAGSGNDGSVDYLITPPLTLADGFELYFDSFFTGTFSQSAYVEYSIDEGATWTELADMSASASWESMMIDLAPIISMDQYPVWIAFHADDNGAWASGWAIDNVAITDGNPPQPEPTPLGFHLFLDGAFVGTADTNFYQYENLTYGVSYEACVAALYCCGLSSTSCYTYTSYYLLPPRNLDGLTFDNAVEVWWNPPLLPVTDAIDIPPYTGPAIVSTVPQMATLDISTNSRETNNPIANETPIDLGDRGSTAYALPGTYGVAEWVSFDVDIPGTFNVIDPAPSYTAFCGDFAKGDNANVYMIEANTQDLFYVNIVTGVSTIVGNTGIGINASGLASDRATGTMYASSATALYTINVATGASTMVGSFGSAGTMIAIACDNNGDLWGIDIADDNLYSINPGTGAATVVGPVGYGANYAQDMGFDPVSGNLYWGAYGGGLDGNLRIVDTSTGASALVGALSGGTEVTVLGFPGGGGGGGGVVPDNLLGYNLYRDMDNIAYIPYNDEDTSYYLDLGLEPMCYAYDVTALYDLTTYGFPGEIGESMYEGTFDVCVEYGWPLPFVEEWNTGSFDPNLWTAGENWVVNGQYGNPMPCSEFKWDPVLTDYSSSLTSYPLDGMYHPGTTDLYIDGRIWFEFDLQLNDNSMSGLEFLRVQVWNDGDWFNVASFDNTDGNFDWTSYIYDITDNAFGNIFKVRFTAEGTNSAGILAWYVDNVNIYRECDAPMNLVADATELPMNEILLTWSPPIGGGGSVTGEWIHWDDGVMFSGVGLGGGTAPYTFSVGSHWDAADLAGFDGMYLTKIRFAADASALTATYTLQVWEGDATTPVYEEPVTGVILGAWNEFTLTTPVPINITEDLWFGYSTTHGEGEFPAGTDAGPAIAGYGDMITQDGGATWDALSLVSTLDYNWSLQAYIGPMVDVASTTPWIPIVGSSVVYGSPNASPFAVEASNKVSVNEGVGTRALTGYNVYWSDDGADYEYLDFTEDTMYLHVNADPFTIGSLQCYYVTAVWADCEPASNEACWIATGIEAPEVLDNISVFPNPARDLLNVTSSSDISHVTIMNYVGQVVYNQKVVEDNDLQLNVAGFETGVYMVKVETSAGIVVKKVTIAH